MTSTHVNSTTTDATWHAVADLLGSNWRWTRQRTPADPEDNWRGWLQGPGGLRLWIHLTHPRWEIGEALDTLVPETGERFYVRDLYSPGDGQPVMAITVSRDRTIAAIAREIERRLLPSVRESRDRLLARRRERAALIARQQEALNAILRRCPCAHRCDPRGHDAPRLMLFPTASLELRIDDRDNITITRWSGLDLDTMLRLIASARPDRQL